MTVYIEYIFLNNLAINYLICYLTLLAVKEEISAVRLLLTGAAGAAFSVLYLFYEGNIIFIQILLSLIMVLLMRRRYASPKDFLVTLIIFYTISFAFAGAAVMISQRIDINNGLNGLAVAGGALISFAAIRYLAGALYERKKEKNFHYPVDIITERGARRYIGYYDSGNKLTYNGLPVAVIGAGLARSLNLSPAGEIAVNTVGGVKILPVVNIRLKIYYGAGANKIYSTKAAVSESVGSGGYDIILHREMGGNDEQTDRKNKRATQKIPHSF